MTNRNSRNPTISEIAKGLTAPKGKVVFALDANTGSHIVFESVYHNGGIQIYVMDQVSDEKNIDENWLEAYR